MSKIIFSIWIVIFVSLKCYAQSFKWQATIDSVTTDGFYRINISPEISTHLKKGFPDLRIILGSVEVPYLLKKEERSVTTTLFKEYSILSKDLHAGGISYITLQNREKTKIDNIHLVIRNADVMKSIKLTGSDDQNLWFMIKDDYEFYSIYNPAGISEIKILNFPLSNYEFYRLEINDKKSKPIDILKAGYYDYNSEKGKYTEVPPPSLTQADSVKKSFIKINFLSPEYVDQLSFEVGGPVYFLRQADLSEVIKTNKNTEYYSPITHLELNSGSSLVYDISIDPAKEMLLQINNEDNLPLKIKSVKAFQLNNYCIAYLNKGKSYMLRFDDDKLSSPVYDLQFFTNKIPADINTLATGKPESIPQPQPQIQKVSPTFFTSNWFIWSAIGVVVALLAFVTTKMLREMGKEG